jgi:hypothetical protein
VAKEELAKAESEKDWRAVIWLHEKPYRVGAFKRYADKLSDAEYWETLAEVWMIVENLHRYKEDIPNLLKSSRPCRERMMTKEERAKLVSLPEKLTVYRGFMPGKNQRGWSWTLNKGKAEWFARRFHRKGAKVAIGTCAKSDVIALLLGRDEDEIIIDPSKVKVTSPNCSPVSNTRLSHRCNGPPDVLRPGRDDAISDSACTRPANEQSPC